MQQVINGFATPEATKAYADRMWSENPKLSPDGWRMLEDLTVAKIATGTYRMDGRDNQPQALEKALLSGLNLVDTSANYMDGCAETFIGQTLAKLIAAGKIKREEVVLVSKAGYIQGQTLDMYRNKPLQDMVQVSDLMWHCIQPEFLIQQCDSSCKRLGVEKLDVFLLHNPEYFLAHAVTNHMEIAEAREIFYQRIEQAFTCLEGLCQQGKIQFYGVSSNTVGFPAENADFVDLAKLNEIAQKAAQTAWGRRKRPLFRVLQMPYNLLEMGIVSNVNTTAHTFNEVEHVSTLELASRMHLSVLINRPLNAFSPDGVAYRLAAGAAMPDISSELAELAEAESSLPKSELPKLSKLAPTLLEKTTDSLQFDHLRTTMLIPLLLQTITEAALSTEDAIEFVAVYQKVIAGLRLAARHQDGLRIKEVEKTLRNRLPQAIADLPLQQLALNITASTPAVTSVLCGLRQVEYVDDAVAVLENGDLPDVAAVFVA